MIILDVMQGSAEWEKARLGIITASRFSDIVTPTGKLSASREAYLCELLAEYRLGARQDEWGGNMWTERGLEMEGEASAFYELETGMTVETIGLVYKDEQKMVAASPDWAAVNDDGEIAGIVECKAPMPKNHLMYWRGVGIGKDYMTQMQAQLWVTGLPWVDGLSYCPGLPPAIVRVEPDEAFQKALNEHIPAFVDELLEARAQLDAAMSQ